MSVFSLPSATPGVLNPYVAGTFGALLTVWVTFAPCFLWIFLGAPYVEKLRNNKVMNGALSGITAAVVGVVLNLSIWFGINAMFGRTGEVHLFGATIPFPIWRPPTGLPCIGCTLVSRHEISKTGYDPRPYWLRWDRISLENIHVGEHHGKDHYSCETHLIAAGKDSHPPRRPAKG